jgi:putative DNA primase/helicase
MSATRTELDKEGIWPTTDAGNGEYFAYLFQNEARYDHRRNRWLLWNQHHWKPDSEGLVYRLALGAARRRYHVAETIEDLKLRLEASKWAIQSESTMKLQSCLALAKNFEPIASDGEGWDHNTFLLGVSNGVVDLKTGDLRLGDREDDITMSTAIDFDQTAECPRFLQFLEEVFVDPGLIDWLWRALGYSITGDTSEQCIFMGYGIGANGKGVLCHAIHAALGDYAYTSPFSTFELYQRASIPNDLAALELKRFVNSSETNDNTRLNEARIKAISGCDPITARYLHQEFFTFWPHLKLWLFVNHKPNVIDDSFGFWRRVRLIPFTKQFTGEADDKQLSTKLRSEAPGILAWLIKGCLEWRERGLDPIPQSVKIATEEYKMESDLLSGFIQDRCIEHPNATVKASELYSVYRDWATGEGIREKDKEYLTSTKFGKRIHQKYKGVHMKDGTYYHGIGLSGDGLVTGFEPNITQNDVFAISTPREEKTLKVPSQPITEATTRHTFDGDYDRKPLNGLTPEQAIEIWRAEGSPEIQLGPGEVCHDLITTLAGDILPRHEAAITQWLTITREAVKGVSEK